MPQNLYWDLQGTGMDFFGTNNIPRVEEIPTPGENELLAKVDAYSICASDIKMINLGNDYPLFKNRDFKKNPARLGHELSLSVALPGKNLEKKWPIGTRFGLQPDVYLKKERYCIGVNVPGGMAQYILLRSEVFNSDNGICVFPVNKNLSSAAVAQTEPFACVESAFKRHTRTEIGRKDDILIWATPSITKKYRIDIQFESQNIYLYDPQKKKNTYFNLICRNLNTIKEFPKQKFDSIIVLGNPIAEDMTYLTGLLKKNSIFCWLPQTSPPRFVDMDIANVHYGNISFIGAVDRRLSSAFNKKKYRYDYKPQGTLLISGGGGAMGRIHVMRALQHEAPPSRIIVTGRNLERLKSLNNTLGTLAKQKNIELITVSFKDKNYKDRADSIIEKYSVSDIVICAPGVEPVEEIMKYLSEDGMLVLFSGTRYGSFAKLPLGLVATSNFNITASSGSSTDDQLDVIKKINSGLLNPDINVAAIGGINNGKKAVQAVLNGKYPGKVIIYPFLENLPLTDLEDAKTLNKEIYNLVQKEGWSRKAEKLLENLYAQKKVELK